MALLVGIVLAPGHLWLTTLPGPIDTPAAEPLRAVGLSVPNDHPDLFAMLIGALVLVNLAAIPVAMLVGFFVGRRTVALPKGIPNGRELLRVQALVGSVVLVASLGRLAIGGAAEQELPSSFSLVTEDASGWRARAVLERKLGAHTLQPLRGADEGVGRPILAVVGGEPFLIGPTSNRDFAYQAVSRDYADLDHRPRFRSMPQWARVQDGTLLVEEADDGTFNAALLRWDSFDGDYERLNASDVGLVLRAPAKLLPYVLGFVLFALALVCIRRPASGARVIAAAWFVQVGVWLLGGVYFHYF